MENKKIILTVIPFFVLALFGALAFAFFDSPAASSDGQIAYSSNVCTDVLRVDGTTEHLGCSHNLVTDDGLDAIRDILGTGASSGAYTWIGLCNATLPSTCTTPQGGDSVLDSEFTGTPNTAGLNRSEGTYSTIGTGNWSIYNTFVAGANNLETNMTGIFNASVGGVMLAENTFTLVTLQTNDQLTVNWTISVTNPA